MFNLAFPIEPVAVISDDGKSVEYSCTNEGADAISFRVNGTSASMDSVYNKGFEQTFTKQLGNNVLRRSLMVSSLEYGSTDISCIGVISKRGKTIRRVVRRAVKGLCGFNCI